MALYWCCAFSHVSCVVIGLRCLSIYRLELGDTMHGNPIQTRRPNGVRFSDWLDLIALLGGGISQYDG
jgi:hypothetical protein